MRLFSFLLVVLMIPLKLFSQHVTVIESQSYNPGHTMDDNWQTVAVGMGFTASIEPQSTLDATAFFATTDILVISSGVITLTTTAIDNITAFVQQGGKVYLQGEYDCAAYNTNSTFELIVNTFGGATFSYLGTTSGMLEPMNVLGSLSSNFNTLTTFDEFWYGCRGLVTSGCSVESYLEYNGEYFGFIYCAPGTNGGRVIQNTDQDWVLTLASEEMMENILANLNDTTLSCAASIFVTLGNDTTICNGTALVLDPQVNGASFVWSDGSTNSTLIVDTTGTYSVTVSAGGCDAIASVDVNVYNTQVNIGNDIALCDGDSIILDATNPFNNYLWSNGDTNASITVSLPGVYVVTTGPAACPFTDSITVSTALSPTVNIGNDTTVCPGELVALNADNPGAQFIWSNDSTTQTIQTNTSGLVWVAVSNGSCAALDSIVISLFNPYEVDVAEYTVVCPGNTTIVSLNAPTVNFNWSTGATTSSIEIASAGSYSVTAVDQNGCSSRDTFEVAFAIPDAFDMQADVDVPCEQTSVELTAAAGFTQYTWSTGDTFPVYTALQSGTYYATVVDENGCSYSDSTRVYFHTCTIVAIPNAFSPNGDGLNDFFKALLNNAPIRYKLTVFNRWGEMVFESADFSHGWDGTWRNKPCDIGTYAWKLDALVVNDNVETRELRQGNVALIR